jgi:hypothetical protein
VLSRPHNDECPLINSTGVFTIIAIKGVSLGLHHVLNLTEVHAPLLKPPSIPHSHRDQSDTIKASALGVLATSDNVEIRKAATKILCERFLSDKRLFTLLQRDLKSDNETVRRQANRAYQMLKRNGLSSRLYSSSHEYRQHALRPWARSLLGSAVQFESRRAGVRNVEESNEERDLRRRRREAVVINEGDRPVSEDDVYMRDVTGDMTQEEFVEGLQRLSEAIEHVEAILNGDASGG